METALIAPTRTDIREGRIRLDYFGKQGIENRNWIPRALISQTGQKDVWRTLRSKDDLAHPQIEERFNTMCDALAGIGVDTAYSPSFGDTRDDGLVWEAFHRKANPIPSRDGKIIVCRGCSTEAMTIPRGLSGIFFTADCHLLVLWIPEVPNIVCVHCSRDNLYSRQMAETGKRGRDYETIVSVGLDLLIHTATMKRFNREKVKAHIAFGIGAKNFSHPLNHKRFSKQNKMMSDHIRNLWEIPQETRCFVGNTGEGNLDIPALIRCQLISSRIPEGNISTDAGSVDTFSDYELVEVDGRRIAVPVWNSQRRPEDAVKKARNMLVVSNLLW